MWQWGYDASKSSLQRIYVDVFACSMTNGGWVKRDSLRSITGGTGNSQINNRLSLLLDNIFVREPLRADKKYYKTKGNMFLKIDVSGTEPETDPGSGTDPHTHNWGEWKTVKEPTVFEAGKQERRCDGCTDIDSKEIPELTPTIKLPATSLTMQKKQTCTCFDTSLLFINYIVEVKIITLEP